MSYWWCQQLQSDELMKLIGGIAIWCRHHRVTKYLLLFLVGLLEAKVFPNSWTVPFLFCVIAKQNVAQKSIYLAFIVIACQNLN